MNSGVNRDRAIHEHSSWLEVLQRPTAPFREAAVADWIEAEARRRRWRAQKDGAGNLWITCGAARPWWYWVAHLDHPGFIALAASGDEIIAQFRGYMRDEYFLAAPVLFYGPEGIVRAQVSAVEADAANHFRRCRLRRCSPGSVPPGAVGMWNLPAMRRRGDRLQARACDDLAGVAAALTALEKLSTEPRTTRRVAVVLTRGEEAGFAGAIWLATHGGLPRASAVISIECSRAQPAAPLGGGACIRVGDRLSLFDSTLTAALWKTAETLMAADPSRRFVRALMPGGVCEATVFQAFGYRTAAVCLPLGNYHNMGPHGAVRPEEIRLSDFDNLVALLCASARQRPPPAVTSEVKRAYLQQLSRLRRFL